MAKRDLRNTLISPPNRMRIGDERCPSPSSPVLSPPSPPRKIRLELPFAAQVPLFFRFLAGARFTLGKSTNSPPLFSLFFFLSFLSLPLGFRSARAVGKKFAIFPRAQLPQFKAARLPWRSSFFFSLLFRLAVMGFDSLFPVFFFPFNRTADGNIRPASALLPLVFPPPPPYLSTYGNADRNVLEGTFYPLGKRSP